MKIHLLLIIAIALASCTDEVVFNPTVDYTGFVCLHGIENDNSINNSGVTVLVEDEKIKAITNEYGKFILEGLEAGKEHKINFSKPEYGGLETLKGPYIGDNEPAFIGEFEMFELPKTDSFNIGVTYKNQILSIDVVTDETQNYCIYALVNDSINVSKDNFDYRQIQYFEYNIGHTQLKISRDFSLDADYPQGITVYFKIYLANYYECINYQEFSGTVNANVNQLSSLVEYPEKFSITIN